MSTISTHPDRAPWVAIEVAADSDLPGAALVRPAVWLLSTTTTVNEEWLESLVGFPGFSAILMQVREVGARSSVVARSWAAGLAKAVGTPLWATQLTESGRNAVFWGSVCNEDGVFAAARELSRSTAYRDTLLWLAPRGAEINASDALPSVFLAQSTGASDGALRIREVREAARSAGSMVLITLRDADQHVGLAITNGICDLPAILRHFENRGHAKADGLRAHRFWPELCS